VIDPPWVQRARAHIGLAEIPGPKHSTAIAGWLSKLRAWWTDDETPWCGVFVAAMLEGHGKLPKHWYRAKAWADWGVRLEQPELGCVAVFERQGGGHVGFVVGRDRVSNLLILGGNQGNKVSIAAFPRHRATAYRWPEDTELVAGALPVGLADLSRGEA
jgi:uncharacterized protein (TIGR02594 family)